MLTTHYKILTPVHDFEPGETHPADSFPRGTDFDRLIRLKVVHPADGTPIPVEDHDAKGWKNRALEAEKQVEELKSKPGSQLAQEERERHLEEIVRLNGVINERNQTIKDNADEYARKVKLLGDPGAMILVLTQERDDARAKLAQYESGGAPETAAPASVGGTATESEEDKSDETPAQMMERLGVNPNTVSEVIQKNSVGEIEEKLNALKVAFDPTKNKQYKAILLAKALSSQ